MIEPDNQKIVLEKPISEIPRHVVIRDRLRAPIFKAYQESQTIDMFIQSVISEWKQDKFFQNKEEDLNNIGQMLTNGQAEASKLLSSNTHITELVQQYGLTSEEFLRLAVASQFIYLSERLILKHLVYGGTLPESILKSVQLRNGSIRVDELTATSIEADTSELRTHPSGVEYVIDSEEGEKIANTILTIFAKAGLAGKIKRARYLFSNRASLGFGRADRQNQIILIGVKTDEDVDWLTKITTALLVFFHELTHDGQKIELPYLIAEVEAFTGQSQLAQQVSDHIRQGIIPEMELGSGGVDFINELQFQDSVRVEGQLGELLKQMADKDILKKIRADHNVPRVESQVDEAVSTGHLPSSIDW